MANACFNHNIRTLLLFDVICHTCSYRKWPVYCERVSDTTWCNGDLDDDADADADASADDDEEEEERKEQ